MHRPKTDPRKESRSGPTRTKLEGRLVGTLELYPIDQETVQKRRLASQEKLSAFRLARSRPATDTFTATSGELVTPTTRLPTNGQIFGQAQHAVSGSVHHVVHDLSTASRSNEIPLHPPPRSLISCNPPAARPEVKARINAETLRRAHRLIEYQLRLRRPEAEMRRAFAALPSMEQSAADSDAFDMPPAGEPSEAVEMVPSPPDVFLTALSPPPPPAPALGPGLRAVPLQAQQGPEGPSAGPASAPSDEAARRRHVLQSLLQGSSPHTLLRELLQRPGGQSSVSALATLSVGISGSQTSVRKSHRPPGGSHGEPDSPDGTSAVDESAATAAVDAAPVAARRLLGVPDHNRGLYAHLRDMWEREHKALLLERAHCRAQRVRTGAWWRLAGSDEGMAASARKAGLDVETYRRLLDTSTAGGVDWASLFGTSSENAEEMRKTAERARRLQLLYAAGLATPDTIARLMEDDLELLRQIDALAAEGGTLSPADGGDFHSLAHVLLKERRRLSGESSTSGKLFESSFLLRNPMGSADGTGSGLIDRRDSQGDVYGRRGSRRSSGALGERDKGWKPGDRELKSEFAGLPPLRAPDEGMGLLLRDGPVSRTTPSPYRTTSSRLRRYISTSDAVEDGDSPEISAMAQTLPPDKLEQCIQDNANGEFVNNLDGRKVSKWWARRPTKAGDGIYHRASGGEEGSVDLDSSKRTEPGEGDKLDKDKVTSTFSKRKSAAEEEKQQEQHRRSNAPSFPKTEAVLPSPSFVGEDIFGDDAGPLRKGNDDVGKAFRRGVNALTKSRRRHSKTTAEIGDDNDKMAILRARQREFWSSRSRSIRQSSVEPLPMSFAVPIDTGSEALSGSVGELSSLLDTDADDLAMFLATFPDALQHVQLRTEALGILTDLELSDDLLTDYALRIQSAPHGVIRHFLNSPTFTPPPLTEVEKAEADDHAQKSGLNIQSLRERFILEAHEEYGDLWRSVQEMREEVHRQGVLLDQCHNDVNNISKPAPGEDRDAYAIRLTREVNAYARTHRLDLRSLADGSKAEENYAEAVRTFLEKFALTRGRFAGRDVGCQCTPRDLGFVDEGVRDAEEQMADLYFHSRKLAEAVKMTIVSVGNVMSFHSVLELEATCKRCFFIFENPRTLWPCGHTFCQSCLADMFTARDELICNECGSSCSVGYTPNPSLELLASYQVVEHQSVDDKDEPVTTSTAQRRSIEGVLASLLRDLLSTKSVLTHSPSTQNRFPIS